MAPTIKSILYGAFGGLFMAVGFNIHGLPSLIFLFLGVLCLSLVLAVQLKNHRIHKMTDLKANIWSLLLFISGSAGVFIFWVQKLPEPRPRPHFIVSLATSAAPTNWVVLTNDFLFFKTTNSESTSAILLMPKQVDDPLVMLKMLVRNDSQEVAAFTELGISFEKEFCPNPQVDWKISKTGNFSSSGQFVYSKYPTITYKFSPILGGDGEETPGVLISQPDSPRLIIIRVRSENSGSLAMQFGLLFETNTQVHKPFFILGKESTNKTLFFNVSAKEIEDAQK